MALKFFLSIMVTIFMLMSTLTSKSTVSAAEDSVLCLKSIKHSLEDPHNNLSSWDLDNPNMIIPGFICKFTGITCWNDRENRIISIDISSLGLKGKFPSDISKCTSVQALNISHNQFYGSIPNNITLPPFLVTLSLSSNRFSGEIPASVGNCTYLNVLELDHNRFTGRIPSIIGELRRIWKFSIAHNLLVGPVPHFVNGLEVNATSYASNPGLCGYRLKPCKS